MNPGGILSLLIALLLEVNTGNLRSTPIWRKTKLATIQKLVFNEEAHTTSRRTPSIPQLTCLGGTAGCDWTPSFVTCKNVGIYDFVPEWKCRADGMPLNRLHFGKVTISCEGFEGPEDPYILVGSCALAYTLDLTKPPASFIESIGFLVLVLVLLYVFSAIGYALNGAFQGEAGFWQGFLAALLMFEPWGGRRRDPPPPPPNNGNADYRRR